MQRKPTKNTPGPNAEEKRWHNWIKQSGKCFVCRRLGTPILHHCEGATFRHLKVLVGHWFCLGLCQDCDDIITHGSRRKFRETFGPQSDFWIEWITHYEQWGHDGPPEEVYLAIMDWGR